MITGDGPSAARRGGEQDEAKAQRKAQLQIIESNLLQLNLEKDKAKDELSKLPENPKKLEQMRRREYLEGEV